MNIYLSRSYIKAYRKLIKNNLQLKNKIKKKIRLFRQNPTNPSLRLHKLKGSKFDTWSFSVEQDLRILLAYVEDGVLFIDIGKHEEVY